MYVYIIVLLFLIVFVAIVLPRRLDKSGAALRVAVQGLVDEYFIAHTELDIEKKRLRFHKLTISADRLLAQILAHFNVHNSSVKQQLRQSLEKNIVTYDQFRALKQFHHMRNEVVHEGLQVYGDGEQIVYGALTVMKTLLAG
jgi:hypothetical protein